MNIIDIIILACLVISVVLGFKDGVIRQLGTLAGIIIAIILANCFGDTVSALLGITGDYAHIWGYAIVLVISLIGVGALATLLRKIFSAVGLGMLDRVAGAALSLIKCVLILSFTLSLFDMFNRSVELVKSETTESSVLYRPIISTSQYIMPTIDWVGDQLPNIAPEE